MLSCLSKIGRAVNAVRPILYVGRRHASADPVGSLPRQNRRTQPPTTAVIARSEATWQSPGRQFVIVHCPRRFPRGDAPRNDRAGDCAFVLPGQSRRTISALRRRNAGDGVPYGCISFRRTQPPTTAVIARRAKPDVAISWKAVRQLTQYQEIPTGRCPSE